MINANQLTVEVYSSGTTRITDPGNLLVKASGIGFGTQYPAGKYTAASFYVPRDITSGWELALGQRVIFRNRLTVVYEGEIDHFEHILGEFTQGTVVHCVGKWAAIMLRRTWIKIWSDNRLDPEIWRASNSLDLEDWQIDRTSRIHMTPNAGAFVANDYIAVRYAMPVGETVKRIVCHEDFSEKAGQDWKMSIYRSTDASAWTEMTGASGETYADGTTTVLSATGNDDIDVTLATPSRYIELRMTSNGDNTVAARDHNHAQWTNLVVYSETSAINIKEVATDIVGTFTVLNADVSHLTANTQDLTPFFSGGDAIGDILLYAASFGDSSNNRWAVGLLDSEQAGTPDGKPVLFAEAFPALTDYDLSLRRDEQNIVGECTLVQDGGQIVNYVIVEYQDLDGFTVRITPTDEATLTNAASVAAYGQREKVLSLGYSTDAVALENGERYLAAYKDPQWVVTSPVTVVNTIRRKNGGDLPVSQIYAGQRVRFEDFISDQAGGGTGLTLLVTQTDYDDTSKTTTLSFGRPMDPLLTMLARPGRIGSEPVEDPTGGDAAGSGGVSRLNWKRQYGLKPGTPMWEEAVRLGKKAFLAKYPNLKRQRR